jgi:hypothetical protein
LAICHFTLAVGYFKNRREPVGAGTGILGAEGVSLPACNRHLKAALILGHCRRRLLSCLTALFHGHVASFLSCP